jgi:hypothetical protein
MKKIGLMLVVFAAILCFNSAPVQAGPCFDWSCDGAGHCNFDASCSTASPYVWKYNFDFGDGSGTGLTGTPTWSHTFSSGYDSTVTLTTYFFSGSGSASVSCDVWHHTLPVSPQPPFSGRCQ